MPNPIGQNEMKHSRQPEESGAEITREMQRRLMLGGAATDPGNRHEPLVREDTIIGRAAAAP